MRAGGCTVQQALSPEAAVVVKQAVSLARRRGNAQVTPLHVASAMLHQPAPAPPPASSSPSPPPPPTTAGLLRAACLRSHSHPLQCKALELCFNVALNRLPASASPLLAGHGHVYYPPSLSNALVAAFKRAQAHQRRGSSVDAQQQPPPVIAVKIELEQLVISILDDPSVSRVMREAGFSSTHVKANVEHAVSSIVEAANNSSASSAAAQNPNPSEETKPSSKMLLLPPLEQVRHEDVAEILECLASRRKRRVMVVAECAAAAEGAARAAVEKIRRGEAAAAGLRSARVVSLGLSAFRDMPRSEAERRLAEIRCAVKQGGASGGGGVVVVVEDLGWAAEFWAARRGEAAGRGTMRWPAASCCGGGYYYCAVEHAVAEVRALACRGGCDGVWLVGYGTYQSYMRCRAGQPSLESLLGLQTIAVPAGSLALSLNCVDDSAMAVSHLSSMAKCEATSGNGSVSRCMSLLDAGGSAGPLTTAVVPACCGDCSDTKCDAAKELARSVLPASSTIIPPWLQHCRSNQEPSHSKKWSSACGDSPSHHRTTALNFSTVVSPSSSVSSYEKHYHLHQQPWPVAASTLESKHQWNARCGGGGGLVHVVVDDGEDVKLVVSAVKKQANSDDSSASNGGSVDQQAAAERRRGSRFKELSAENLKVLCSALEKEVPWQADLAPEIASTVLRCRSGMARRRRSSAAAAGAKEDTWLLFLGGDAEGKARVARKLARLVFGSRSSFVSIGATAASSPVRSSDSNKRSRLLAESDNGGGAVERLYEAVRDDPHRVILVENVEQACQRGIVQAIESGVVRSHGGGEAAVGDAIVILSCESFDARSRTSSPPATKKAKTESEEAPKEEEDRAAASLSLSCFDLNMSVQNDDMEESCFADDDDLLKAVDRAFVFRRPDQSSD
ncbi:unnamed protein product [Urochloa decumbens]|uniref:Clp R domain-containing protein n=1 Tax=Urochloa decumbens TaxID=240449 RepID=A0ABC9H710_9POAL